MWRSRTSTVVILFFLMALPIAQNAWYWPQLPNRVATHFDADGDADSWMTKANATLLMCGIQVGMPLLLVGLAWIIPTMPGSSINIPHRAYWLHPDRRGDSLIWIRGLLLSMAVLTSLLTMVIAHLTFVANVAGNELQVGRAGLALAVYIACVVALIVRLFWRFRMPKEAMSY